MTVIRSGELVVLPFDHRTWSLIGSPTLAGDGHSTS